MEWYTPELEKVLLSALLGAIIGLEREWSGKSAGFRTVILVNIGATLFTIVSNAMAEPGTSGGDRIASNVVTGIGFLGAGLIFKSDTNVRGLTTAATVWASAAIGMAVGVGAYEIAVMSTILVWAVLVIFFRLQLIFDDMMITRQYHITHEGNDGKELDYSQYFQVGKRRILEHKQIKTKEGLVYIWTIRASKKKHDDALKILLHDPKVTSLEY